MKKRATLFFNISLLILDMLLVGLAFVLAYYLRLATEYPPPLNIPPLSQYSGMMLIQTSSFVAVFFFQKHYHRQRAFSHFDEFSAVFSGSSIGALLSVAITSFVFKNELDYPRLMIAYAWGLTIILLTLGRIVHSRIRWSLRSRGVEEERVLIVGPGEVGQLIEKQIKNTPGLGYRVVGFVAPNGTTPPAENYRTILGRSEEIPRLIQEHHIDEVIIALPDAPHEQLLEIISQCQLGQVAIKVFPDVFQFLASEVQVGDLGGLPLLTVKDTALRGWRLTLKRGMDLVLSAIGLILLSPLMLLMAILIRLDSKGSVFYTQERMGLDAKPFQLLKFRSMHAGAEEETGPVWASRHDPRVTRMGRWLRRFSLDELPQLINVFLGEMSLVGPRPERPVFVEQFRKMIPRYMERHAEKAGMTGWAQINGLRGDSSIFERTKYDLYYIENWSLWFDFKIILKTLVQIFRDRAAY
ncbi:MAG: undecaprenyl-phosphate glucose phosphotransferase [Chloroflexi bacterium]|nr:undecaprenyl-phosphate glucose phosphotransferase [Chloroflexota bacterium]